jgi:PBSX family phage terminase large subunit
MRNLSRKSKKFKWVQLSRKQYISLSWWAREETKHLNGIIADGSRRSGKTLSVARGFIEWAQSTFDGEALIVGGKTIGSFKRNVYYQLRSALEADGYLLSWKTTESYFVVRSPNGIENYYYVFGGKDVASADMVQGMTSAGMLLDEAVLMPEEFIAMCMSSCSVPGAKFWFTCNPNNPNHFFKKEFIDKAEEKGLLYIHFTMDDNLSLTNETKQLFKTQFTGVFFKRYILGLWVIAEGLIYEKIANFPQSFIIKKEDVNPSDLMGIYIGVDFGGNKSATTFVAVGFTRMWQKVIVLKSTRRVDENGKPMKDDPIDLAEAFLKFYNQVNKDYPFKIKECYVDSAEQVLKRGLENRMIKENVRLNINNSKKREINERIQLVIELASENRIKFVDGEADTAIKAFSEAMWEENQFEDRRLDDGSTDIDTIDGTEYAIEPFMHELQSAILRT